jgi:hypothetical protein
MTRDAALARAEDSAAATRVLRAGRRLVRVPLDRAAVRLAERLAVGLMT